MDPHRARPRRGRRHGEQTGARARCHVCWRPLAARESRLHCEGAVAAAVPIVRALRESLAGEEIHALRGVLNGTTTFVLGRLEQQRPFADAVTDAQREGFAERDPSDDLSGADAAAKLAILCSIAWREPVTLDRVRVRGIDADGRRDRSTPPASTAVASGSSRSA